MVLIGSLTAVHDTFYRCSVTTVVKTLLGVNHRIDKLNTHYVKGGMLKQQLRQRDTVQFFFQEILFSKGCMYMICTSICELPGQAIAVVFNWFEVTPEFL